MRHVPLSVMGLLVCAAPQAAQVRPGIEVLVADPGTLLGAKRIGLLTNQTGVDPSGRRDVDLLRGSVDVLFSPEHGFRGTEDRPGLPDAVDSATGLPIYSLYGPEPAAALAALERVDVLVVDLQDVGARYYTYPQTATWLMREAARRSKAVLVLDRPNPIGGLLVQGAVPRRSAAPDTGLFAPLPVPMRHGMTLGELLRFANDVLAIHARLRVVPARGWRRHMYSDQTGLPWVKPSPNMPDLESAMHYPGICLFEATNLSVGRGTAFAFQAVGARWLDTAAVLRVLKDRLPGRRTALAGVRVVGLAFTPRAPTDAKYDGVALQGLRLRVTDRRRYDPTKTAVLLLAAILAVHRDSLRLDATRFDELAGGAELREAILARRPPPVVWQAWAPALARFQRERAQYLLY